MTYLQAIKELKNSYDPKKGNWKNYLVNILFLLREEVTTHEVAIFIIVNNKDTTLTSAQQTCSDLLPELAKEGRIKQFIRESRKEGNLYQSLV